MKPRAWLYVNSPSNSKQSMLRQLNQLASFVIRKDYIIVGIFVDSISIKHEFYERDGTSYGILEAAKEGKFDILLLTNMKQIIPKNGWGDIIRFNNTLSKYGVQIYDLVIQDTPLTDTNDQLIERVIGHKIFSIKEDRKSIYKFYHTGASFIQISR
jgi:hypothetical protein